MGVLEFDIKRIAEEVLEALFDEIHLLKMASNADAFILHAPPFGGKDTIAEIMALVFGGEWASSGALLRKAQLDSEGKESLDKGDVVDSDIFFTHALPLIAGPDQDGKVLWLSAVGRRKGEPKRVAEFLEGRGHKVAAVVYIEADPEVLRRRRTIGRSGDPRPDDGADEFEHRLDEFELWTLPAIQEYGALAPLIRVNGAQHPRDVALEVVRGLYAALIG